MEQGGTLPQSLALGSRLLVNRKIIQRMSASIALLSLATLAVSFYFLPTLSVAPASFVFVMLLGTAFFLVYYFLPQIYFHETFLLLGDAIYIAIVTYIASIAGQYGVLILFLYFVIIVADALKYPLSEYVVVILLILQAAFFYVLAIAPYTVSVRIGILTIFTFCTISIAVFVWYFVYQTIYERSIRYVLERKSNYLKALNDHLVAVDIMRSNMLKVASHEFQTPLLAIQNSLSLMQRADLGRLTPKQLQLVHLATANNQRLENLIHNLLDTARIQSGEWKLSIAKFDLTKLLRDIVSEYKSSAEAKSQKLTVNLLHQPVEMWGDCRMLRIAYKNILDNAIRYTPEGGSVVISIAPDEKQVVVKVSDTGIGMSHEVLSRLFSQFNRTDGAIHASPDGYGLGLYFSRIIARKHGGDITATSREGRGSNFSIVLPKRPPGVKYNKGEKNGDVKTN